MPFQNLPLNITGPSAEHRDKNLSAQFTQNFYTEVVPGAKGAEQAFVLQSYPGQSLFGSAVGVDRGQHTMQGISYRVAGSTLFEVSSAGTHTSRGTISGTARCTFYNDGANLAICSSDGQGVFNYFQSTQTLTVITDSNIVGSTAVTGINNQAIYTNVDQAAGIDFVVAAVADPTTASGLDAAGVDIERFSLVRSFSLDATVYMFTAKKVSLYWNNPASRPPLDRFNGKDIPVGLDALHSIANTDQFLYWLGDDKSIYRLVPNTNSRQIISSPTMDHAVENYAVTTDAIAYEFRIEGMNFYQITFPSEGKTWLLNEALGREGWTNLSSDTVRGPYNAVSHTFNYNKHLIADATTGDLYQLDIDAFDNNGSVIQRIRTTSEVNSTLLGVHGRRVKISRLIINMRKGVGIISGQGADPQMIVEYSTDGARSFKEIERVNIGRLGETDFQVIAEELIDDLEVIFRLTTSDPVYYSIYDASVDIKIGGKF